MRDGFSASDSPRAEMASPNHVVGGVDDAVLISIGVQAGANLAEMMLPHIEIGLVDNVVAVVVSG